MDEFKIDSFFIGDTINPALITDEGEKNIKKLVKYLTESSKQYDNNKALSINQLRKFYDSFLKIYSNKAEEKEKKIQLLMLKANAEYSAKRLRTYRFNDFLSNRISIVISKSGEEFKKNLDAFKLHFEALVAYYSSEEQK